MAIGLGRKVECGGVDNRGGGRPAKDWVGEEGFGCGWGGVNFVERSWSI